MADMVDIEPRPGKRIRQACEPCRRKKTRCPGEKPRCSFCERLHQPCIYADESGGTSNEPPQWAELLDRKIDTLIGHLGFPASGNRQPTPQMSLDNVQSRLPPDEQEADISGYEHTPLYISNTADGSSTFNSLEPPPPLNTVLTVAKLYARHCYCQPLPLFQVDQLCDNAQCYSWEVLFAILAVALRFSQDSRFRDDNVRQSRRYADSSSRLVMRKFTEGRVELSTIQALCLLAFVDLTNGYTQRAWANVGLGLHLSQSAQLGANTGSTINPALAEERHSCFWSLRMLGMMCSDGKQSILSAPDKLYPYPSSIPKPFNDLVAEGAVTNLGGGQLQDLGIVAYTLQLTEIWQETLRYSNTRLDITSKAPWLRDSKYSEIMDRLMQFETTLPESHRFVTGRFTDQDTQSLNNYSGYWGPWLFAQFIYHTISCLLFHPFLVSQEMKARSTRFPFTYIDNCRGLVFLHSNWIDIFIGMIAEKDFPISDPFVAYCASVAASVHIWYLYAEDEEIREQARSKFRRCYRFITGMATQWPIVQDMIDNLNMLSNRASGWRSHVPFTPHEIPAADKPFIWNILTYASDGKQSTSDGRLFHASIDPSIVLKPAHNLSARNLGDMSSSSSLAADTIMPTGIPYVVDPTQTPQSGRSGSSGILEPRVLSSILPGDNETIGQDFNGQIPSYNKYGWYGWSGMGNL